MGYIAGDNVVWVDIDLLSKFMAEGLMGVGVPKEDARVCADVLSEADKRGVDSHGVARFKQFYYDRIKAGIQNAVTNFEIVREGPTTAVVDGHQGMGMVIAKRSMQMAIDKAKKFGMGMVVVRNSTHYGIAGYYTTMAAKAGMIGMSGTNARPSVAPTFGTENMLGTNPLAIAMPTDEKFPFNIDCATSLVQRGKVEVYDRAGKDLPSGWVIDEKGRTRTDAHQILEDLVGGKAALTPLGGVGDENGGHKGYGYSVAVELLSSALQQGSYLQMLSGIDSKGKKAPINVGHFFIAIDISAFVEPKKFKKSAGDLLRELRASRKMPGRKRIYTAGELAYLTYLERKKKGVPVNDVLQNELLQVQKEVGLKEYHFKFK